MGAVALALNNSSTSAVSVNNSSYTGAGKIGTASSLNTPPTSSPVSRGSSLARTLSSLGRVVAPIATVASRFNPYLSAAMLLYEGYEYFTSDTGSSSSGSSASVVGTTQQSSPAVVYSESMKHLTDNPVTVLPRLDLDSFDSYNGKTLLDVLSSNNNQIMHGMSMLVDSNNAVAVSSSNIAKSVNALGVILAQIASDNSAMSSITSSFYVDLLRILGNAFPEKAKSSDNDRKIKDDIDSLDMGTAGYSYPASSNGYITTTETVLSDDAITDTDSVTNSLFDMTGVIDAITSLNDSINPDGRADYFPKQNEIADYHLTPADIKDLDGQTVVNDTPLNVKTRSEASTARKHTDENNFELDDDDFDFWNTLPTMEFLQNYDYSSVDDV